VQSLVRDETKRALLFDMDTAIQRLNASDADVEALPRGPLQQSFATLE
jgi:PKHD-type hydroxylase